MKRAILVLVMLLVTIVTTIAEVKTDYVNLNGTVYQLNDYSENVPAGFDIMKESIKKILDSDNMMLISVDPILSWDPGISRAIDSRIAAGDKFNSEGEKFYKGQLMYSYKSGNVHHVILAGYGIFGGVRTTTMYHIAYQEVK